MKNKEHPTTNHETLIHASREAILDIIDHFGPNGETGFITQKNKVGDQTILWSEKNGTEHLTVKKAA